jgi:hypothetical protein
MLPISVTSAAVVASTSNIWTYDLPTIFEVHGVSGTIFDGSIVNLIGTNFGRNDYSVAASVTSSSDPGEKIGGMSWTSDSIITAFLLPVLGLPTVTLTAGNARSQPLVVTFSYVPNISLAIPAWHEAAGDRYINFTHIYGSQFGMQDYTPRSSSKETACESTVWISGTYLKCKTAAGTGKNQKHLVTLNLHTGAGMSNSFSYYEPSISKVLQRGRKEARVHGVHFGHGADYTPIMSISGTRCLITSWISDSSLLSMAAIGITYLGECHLLLYARSHSKSHHIKLQET